MNAIDVTDSTLYKWLSEIPDPEIPVVTILDLGILRYAHVDKMREDGTIAAVTVGITPTYSGCPAMDMISMQIRMKLLSHDVTDIVIKEELQPAWSSDWISAEGLKKMKAYGIAPPQRKSKDALGLFEEDEVECPRCNSNDTTLISNFGATSCKAMYQCNACKEPFEHFKCH